MPFKKPEFRLINKSKRSKWFSVFVKFQYEDKYEFAKFRHAGSAYAYAAKLHDNANTYAERMELIEAEC